MLIPVQGHVTTLPLQKLEVFLTCRDPKIQCSAIIRRQNSAPLCEDCVNHYNTINEAMCGANFKYFSSPWIYFQRQQGAIAAFQSNVTKTQRYATEFHPPVLW
ncbi:hypothetical protein ACTXT7_009993 [Hymenolepis weldensis]